MYKVLYALPPLICPQTRAVSDHYPIELRLQGTGVANAMANDNKSDDDSDTAQTMSLSCVVVLSVVVVTTHLLM